MSLNDALRDQLDRDLADLPELAATLLRHYRDLVGRGERGDDDPAARYPARFAVLDLADRRPKAPCAGHACPGCPTCDAAGEADLAARIGARRVGILPGLIAWVSHFVGELDPSAIVLEPSDPARVRWVTRPDQTVVAQTGWEPNVAREAHWLRVHLPAIAALPSALELARDVRGMVRELEEHVGPNGGPRPDHEVLATETDLRWMLDVPRGTISWWTTTGRLPQAVNRQTGQRLVDRHGHRLYFVADAGVLVAKREHSATRRLPKVAG